MSLPLTPLRGRKPVHWTTVLGLLLVPLTVAGLLLWGLWNPTERLDTVTAAVVNHDEPVEVDGQLVPLGRVLAGELIGSASPSDPPGESGSGSDTDEPANFTWVLTDEDDARQGLDDGRYSTVVTIPENFSAAATSLSSGPDDAEQAHIDIAESDRGRLIDTALSGIVTQTATSVLNQQLGSQFVGGVFVGMNELHGGIGEAADGAAQLADGGAQLADGAGSLAEGAAQLSEGTQQLSAGAGELASGAGQLSAGVGALSGGAGELATGAAGLADGVGRYVDGASTLAQSYAPLEQGTVAAATQLKTLVSALGRLQVDAAEPQSQLESGMTAAGAAAAGLGEDLGTLYPQCLASGATQEFCDSMLATLQTRAGEIGAGLSTAQTGAEGLGSAMTTLQGSVGGGHPGGGDPTAQLDQLIAGTGEFGRGLESFAAQGADLSAGASQLADGSVELSSGTSQLSEGASGLASGASQLASGTSELAANAPQLAEGASQLAEGTERSASGAGDLASGLDEAVNGIPNYTEAQRDRLAETAVAPVEARGVSDELFNASGVPLFAGIALWAGALAAFLVLAPLWHRTRDAARGVGWITLRSAAPAVALGAVQGAIAGIVLPLALGYELGRGAAFFGLALLAGVAFALVVQGLSALLGGFGRFVAFVLLVVAFAVGIVSTVPGPLAAAGDASPIGAALEGFQAIATGASGAGIAAVVLALWALGGLVLTVLAVARDRRRA